MSDKRFQKKLKKIEKKGERQKAKSELEAKYAEYYPSKRRKVSNIMLVVVVTAIVLYTIASFILQFYTSVEISSTLTTCFYAFWSSELIALTTLKTSKIIKGTDKEDIKNDIPCAEDEDREGDCESEEV